jgi:eukaryotic-like serine/threonine-protein kinase
MGEVYRARDTRLGRDVAIKVLPAALASDPDRLARFDREARLLATLNHPHIATIHGIEHSDDVRALVLELVEGPTLADLIARGPIPVGEALRLAGQIADALDAAHAKGIIHRDLKPANIKVTVEGQVKVLDFGLAKALAADGSGGDLSQLPTVTTAGTLAGVILGTAAYMSPEQARGHPLDKRTDIWAFGCVVYEMVTGRRPFTGATLSDTMAAILEREPDWSVLPLSLPPGATRLLRRCLEKDLKRRLRDIGNTKIDLDESLTAAMPPTTQTAAGARRTPGWTWLVLATAAVLVGGLLLSWQFGFLGTGPARSVQGGSISRFVERLPDGLQLAPAPAFALAPDGRRLAYVAIRNDTRAIYVRNLDDLSPRALAGSENADQPFFSPDGAWIGFFAEGKLKKIAVAGGAPLVLCDVTNPRGGAWLPDNSIVFAPSAASVLLRVSAAGGRPEPVSTLDRQLNEASHRWPHVLPGGDAILFGAGPTVSALGWIEAHIVAQSLKTNRRQQVAAHGTFPHYTSPGHLVYVQSGIVYAQKFDPVRFEVTGDAFPVLEQVTQGGGINGGAFQWATSPTGMLAYVPGFSRESELVLVDRTGTERTLLSGGAYSGPRLSPDGHRVAFTVVGAADSEVWIHDIDRGTTARLTSGGRNLWPVWSPDGTQVAYGSSRSGSTNVYVRRADGDGGETQLTSTQYTYIPQSWSPSGGDLVLSEVDPQRLIRIALLPMQGSRTPTPFLTGEGSATIASFSSDGNFVAYVSNQSGRNEVYVRPYPGPGAPLQVSTSGGDEPVWSRKGHELFFRRGEVIMAVELASAGTRLVAGTAKQVVSGRYAAGAVRSGFDVSADGRTFLMAKLLQPRDNLSQFNLVLNWFEAIKQQVP